MDFQQLVTVAPWTIILQICNLLLQMYLFKRFLLKPVNKTREQLEEVSPKNRTIKAIIIQIPQS